MHTGWKEMIFQIVLHLLVFSFYSFDRGQPGIETYRIVFFLNYALIAAVINYYLLPRFFYKKKYAVFFGSILLLVVLVMLIEEQFLEKIFFPNTRRAETFPGIFITLLQILPVITILSGFKFAWDAISKQREVEELRAVIKEMGIYL